MDPVARKEDDREYDESKLEEFLWTAQTIRTHTVQCAKCGKYRVIPDKNHYECIREHIHERPWVCDDASPWNPLARCEVPDEIADNPEYILTFDRAGIPATPAGWERLVHIRAGPNRRKFSDIFYCTPPGSLSLTDRRMRSYQDIKRTVKKHPALLPAAVNLNTRFSFATPALPAQYGAGIRTSPIKSQGGLTRKGLQRKASRGRVGIPGIRKAIRFLQKKKQSKSAICTAPHKKPISTGQTGDMQLNEKLTQSQASTSESVHVRDTAAGESHEDISDAQVQLDLTEKHKCTQ